MKEQLTKMRSEVFSKRKILSKIYDNFGKLSLKDYVRQWQMVNTEPNAEVLLVISNFLEKFYGHEVAFKTLLQLKQTGLVSTIDHHGIWGHPFFLNSNLVYSLHPNIGSLVVFATAGVSLNNSSWPGALSFFSKKTQSLKKLSFFADSKKMQTVFSTEAILPVHVEKVLKGIQTADFLNSDEKIKLQSLVFELFSNQKNNLQTNFSDQACVLSLVFWKKIFPNAPSLLYLSLEEIVREVLQKIIFVDTKNIIYKTFFEHSEEIVKFFWGAKGCFAQNYGTFLFWGLDLKGHRVALTRSGEKLVGKNFQLIFTAQTVAQALARRQIYPSSLTCFLVLLWAGLGCVGGFNQTTWLTEIKERFAQMLSEVGEETEAKKTVVVPTENFAEGIILFEKLKNKFYIPSAVNIFVEQKSGFFTDFKKQAEQVTVAESIDLQIPEIFKIGT